MDDPKKWRLADPDTAAAMDEAADRAQFRFYSLIVEAAIEMEKIRDDRDLADLNESERLAHAEFKARFEDLLRQQEEFKHAEFKRLSSL